MVGNGEKMLLMRFLVHDNWVFTCTEIVLSYTRILLAGEMLINIDLSTFKYKYIC